MSHRGRRGGGQAGRSGGQAGRGGGQAGRGGGQAGRGGGGGDQPRPAFPAPSAPPGGGRGAWGAAGRGPGPQPSAAAPSPRPAAPSPRPAAPAVAPPTGAASSSKAPPPSSAPAESSATQLAADVAKQLSLNRPASLDHPPKRPDYGKIGTKCMVRSNHFLVDVADKDFCHYDVTIVPEVTSKGVCRQVISKLVQVYKESHLGKRLAAYDGRKSLYTAGPFPFDSKEFEVRLPEKDGCASSSKRKERLFKVTLKLVSQCDMHGLREFLQGRQTECPQETIHLLDVVLRSTPSELYSVIGRSFFHPNLGGKGPLQDGLEYWRGYYQSLRPTQLGLSVNIDLSARAFYDPVMVTEFVQSHFKIRDLNRRLSDQDRLKLKRALRGVKVELVHQEYPRTYKITGISPEPAGSTMFTLDDKKTKVSVAQYFREKYKIAVKYPNLPCLQSGSDARPVFVPMEVCKIVPGQRYTKKLNENQVRNLLKATCQRPAEREGNIRQTIRQRGFGHDDLVSKEFGIRVSEELALLPARVLPPPVVNYHASGRDNTVRPMMGQWNMINKKMFQGAGIHAWACINFSTWLNNNIPYDFCDGLVSMCNSRGMEFNPHPVLDIKFANPSQIERALMEVHKESVAKLANSNAPKKSLQLLIIILPDLSGSYGRIKRICETELGIVSQCCKPKEISKQSMQYLENVSLKINVKVGGINSVLDDAVRKRIPYITDRPTIIFGADVTHPQSGDDSSPSIAAVVASMDWPTVTKYRCLVSAQAHREEIIQDLFNKVPNQKGELVNRSMIMELLKAFKRSTGWKPQRIIFYRDGVSEGQFSQVLLYEVDAIRKACNTLEEGYLPPITFVVVQKRHHTRFFPENHQRRDMTDKSGNILPGTVVDTNICHPTEFDFYLNSHAGIQGTSRPAHYHVLYDENAFRADALQMLTNNLCYTYARCTRAVSIVTPAYYAHLAAFRARYYIEGDTSDGSSSGGHGAREGGAVGFRQLPAIKDNVLDVMFFC